MENTSDRPTVHTGSNLSAPVWLRYPYQRGTDNKNGVVWLRSIWLPCEATDRIQEKVQIGNETNFVCKRGLSAFLLSTSNMYLPLIGPTWIRSRVHANHFGSDPVCMPEKHWIRSKKERSRTDPLTCAQGLSDAVFFAISRTRTICSGLCYFWPSVLTVANHTDRQ